MTVWSGLGVNYGHSISASVYDTTQVESDLIFLKSRGITNIRVVFPSYNASVVPNCQNLVTRCLAHGFYTIWGVALGVSSPNLTATWWAGYKTYVTGTLAPWAQSVGLSELALGNECDLAVDGTTLTLATMRSDVRSMCTTVKSGGFTGKVTYDTAAQGAIIDAWLADGLGSLDAIGWNNYNGSVGFFTTQGARILSDFGVSKSYISEFGSNGGGFSDFNDENAFASDSLTRISVMQGQGYTSAYFFCYRDGGFGLSANSYALTKTSNEPRVARGAILNTPGQVMSTFGVK